MITVEIDTNHQLISASKGVLNDSERIKQHSYGQLGHALAPHDQLDEAGKRLLCAGQKDLSLDPAQDWVYVGSYDNSATGADGNDNAGVHLLYATIRNDGKLELAWTKNFTPFKSTSQHIVRKHKFKEDGSDEYIDLGNDANHNGLRIASKQESDAYMLSSTGQLKVYTYPKCIYYYSWAGYYFDERTFFIKKVFGCPVDVWMCTHDNVIYLHLHTPSNMQTFKSFSEVPSEISNYYVTKSSGSMHILQPRLSYIVNNLMSHEPIVHNRVIALMPYTYEVEGMRFLEVGDAYKSIQAISSYGVYPQNTAPYYIHNDSTDLGIFLDDKNSDEMFVEGVSGWLPYSYYTYTSISPTPDDQPKRMTGMGFASKGNSIRCNNMIYQFE